MLWGGGERGCGLWYDLQIITSWLEGPATSTEPVLASTGPAAARRTLDAPEQCYRSTDLRISAM